MVAALGLIVTVEISYSWLGSSFQTKSGSCGRNVMWVLRLVHFLLGRLITLFGYQVVDAFLVFHFYLCSSIILFYSI
jgi:hypothetical protein